MGVNETKRLYVRVPFRILQELQIKELHPDLKRVVLARQKNARWSHIEFENKEKCLAAFKQLKKIRGKYIRVATAAPRDDSFIAVKSKKLRKNNSAESTTN